MIIESEVGAYPGYLYAYPHKHAYRPFEPRPRLQDVWAREDRSSLALYIHIPFCEMRCGFCNLFTVSHPGQDVVAAYIDALERQSGAVFDAMGDFSIAEITIGGGTPTMLSSDQLDRVCSVARSRTGASAASLAIECSPATVNAEKLAVLDRHGTDRVSLGVQSFEINETRSMARPQASGSAETALDAIRTHTSARLNVDLIYGTADQTPESFVRSVNRALDWKPEELYLYPLYVRPLTGLGRKGQSWDDHRREIYRAARTVLLESGYEQRSMRAFVSAGTEPTTTEYTCQRDGMIGLGCGARSYTRDLHYSFDYAVGAASARTIIQDYVERPASEFELAEIGIVLNDDEQQRRFVIKSILRSDGLDLEAYRLRFGSEAMSDLPDLQRFIAAGWLEERRRWLRPTELGLEWSDRMGTELVSTSIRQAMDSWEQR